MAAGAGDFCDNGNYVAADDIDDLIAQDSADFFRRYRSWEAANAPAAPGDMFLYFGGWETSRDALDAGDSSQDRTAGRVRESHCVRFNDFVAGGSSAKTTYSEVELHELGLPFIEPKDIDETYRLVFHAALSKFVSGSPVDALTYLERAMLNGAILAKVDIPAIGSSQAVQRLYAVPGHVVLDGNIKDEAFGANVDQVMENAFKAVGTRLINLNGVVQLRLSADDEEAQKPVVVAPGVTIMGGA